ncbi:MAG: ferredoxin [Verrucomicrobium sp.]|nr:ferredoxin [Verrucomicrobium sp.]
MPDSQNKVARSVSGPFYVDNDCIDCDRCREIAPSIFGRDDSAGLSFVQRQPSTPEEMAQCADALDCCPVEAIGNDGE